jgi:flagellar biosynthesis protein FlhB
MASDRTEKATPKRRDEARRKGQVARSSDLNGAVILLAGLLALSSAGPAMVRRMEEALAGLLTMARDPAMVDQKGVGELFATVFGHVALAAAPVAGACALAAVVVNLAQVGLKPAPGALKPDVKRLNPVQGLKNLLGLNAPVEAVKSIVKVAAVGGIAALAVLPRLDELAAMVGTPAGALLPQLASTVLAIARRGAAAYLLIAVADFLWQRYRHEKGMRMDKQAVKDEFKQQQLPGEVKGAQRRRAMELARARMMDAVPTADVVVTNPTHFSVALRYDGANPAPVVVAKGADHVAFKMRELAREHGVTVVPDPPLARTLYASVDLGKQIPEDLFQAVAQLLAYVYRVAGARRAAAGAAA